MSSVTLTAGEVRHLRRLLAVEADESVADADRRTALMEMCGFLAAALDDEQPEFDHAATAADHVLALVAARAPEIGLTPAMHDAVVELVSTVSAALAAGWSR